MQTTGHGSTAVNLFLLLHYTYLFSTLSCLDAELHFFPLNINFNMQTKWATSPQPILILILSHIGMIITAVN